jgi:hypothetical protein
MKRSYTAKVNGFEGPAKVINDRRITVADVYTDREPGDQRETAALFAAAPELLATLRAIVAEAGPQFGHDDGPGTINRIARAARAAIARAEGR